MGDVFFYPVDLLAIAMAWGASRRCRERGRLRLAWGVLAAAFACYLAGDIAWTVYEVAGVKPYPSLADVFYLAFYPLMLWALLLFSVGRRSVAERVRIGLDLAVVALAGAMLVVYVVLGPTIVHSGPDGLQTGIAIAYPVGDVVLLVGLGSVLLRRCDRSSVRALKVLAAGLIFFVAADLVYGYLTLHSSYEGGDPVDSLWMIAVAMFAVSGAAQDAPERSVDGAPSRGLGRVDWTPYIGVAVCFGLLLAVHGHDRLLPDLVLLISSILVATFVSIRQFLAHQDLIRTQDRAIHQAAHDALTGLPNRALAIERAQSMLENARTTGASVAALRVDIDDFKHVNDSFGHAAGDELLRAIAARLSAAVRDSDMVARLGGDEFVVLLDISGRGPEPEVVAERISGALREPFELDGAVGRSLSLTASIGLAITRDARADGLLRDSDFALQEAKSGGRGRWVALGSELQHAIQERHAIQLDLNDALSGEQFFLLYQPIIDLRSLQIVGVEALIRWRHPDRGIIPPDEFIRLAEDTGQIVAIGRWVLDNACRQAAIWQGDRHPIGVWVNVSARQLEHDGFVAEVADALTRTGLWPAALTLEITETTLMRDPVGAARRLNDLKALGARIAVDDFGAGHSSLVYLRQLPVDVVKIDRSFVSGIAASDKSSALTHTLVQLGKTLGLHTLGEGIEELSQLQRLQAEQCDFGQGYLFARPAPADAISDLLSSESTLAPTTARPGLPPVPWHGPSGAGRRRTRRSHQPTD